MIEGNGLQLSRNQRGSDALAKERILKAVTLKHNMINGLSTSLNCAQWKLQRHVWIESGLYVIVSYQLSRIQQRVFLAN